MSATRFKKGPEDSSVVESKKGKSVLVVEVEDKLEVLQNEIDNRLSLGYILHSVVPSGGGGLYVIFKIRETNFSRITG